MEEIKLDVQVRQEIGRRRIKSVIRENFVPAIVYGGESAPTPIKVVRREYEKIMRRLKGQSVVFHLNVLEGEKKLRDYTAILKDEQLHPVSDSLVHIDFQRISLSEELEVQVPIEIKGEAIGVKQDGGSLDHPMWELDVVCLPTNIPAKIVIDVSDLKIGDLIHVRDVQLPANVKTKHDPDAIVLSIVPPMKEEEDALVQETVELEVTKEKKVAPEVKDQKGDKPDQTKKA